MLTSAESDCVEHKQEFLTDGHESTDLVGPSVADNQSSQYQQHDAITVPEPAQEVEAMECESADQAGLSETETQALQHQQHDGLTVPEPPILCQEAYGEHGVPPFEPTHGVEGAMAFESSVDWKHFHQLEPVPPHLPPDAILGMEVARPGMNVVYDEWSPPTLQSPEVVEFLEGPIFHVAESHEVRHHSLF